MGALVSKFSRHNDEEQYRFWSAIASSLRLGWLGSEDKDREVKVCQYALFPLLLNTSALQGDIVTIQTHIQQGADVCMPDSRGRTALHLAASEADVQTVGFLLAKGAEINARDHVGGTPILDAIRCKNLEVIKFLVNKGAMLDMSDVDLGTEMCCLAYLGDLEQMEAWRVAGVSLNYADADGRTPLHVAVCTNQEDVVKYCMKHGANLELRDRFNNRPIDDAQRLSLTNLEEVLNSKGKKHMAKTSDAIPEA
ncbi:L-asparaginase [Engraulis encrasicolus]|uniref:L-asparaginase n=1 Tax=Engraulis encrasicolus TaxID=184585 RepID=UPI002FD78260